MAVGPLECLESQNEHKDPEKFPRALCLSSPLKWVGKQWVYHSENGVNSALLDISQFGLEGFLSGSIEGKLEKAEVCNNPERNIDPECSAGG